MKQLIFLIFLLPVYNNVLSQSNSTCTKIYDGDEVDQEAIYKSGSQSILFDTRKEIYPVFSDCAENGDELITSMRAKLTVDSEGKVIDVVFIRFNASDKCKELVKQKMMSLTGWTPATKDGVNVCSYYYWIISCILSD